MTRRSYVQNLYSVLAAAIQPVTINLAIAKLGSYSPACVRTEGQGIRSYEPLTMVHKRVRRSYLLHASV